METIIMYTLPNCIKCEKLKVWLSENNIDFEEILMDTDVKTKLIMQNVFGDPPILQSCKGLVTSDTFFKGNNLIFDILDVMRGIYKSLGVIE